MNYVKLVAVHVMAAICLVPGATAVEMAAAVAIAGEAAASAMTVAVAVATVVAVADAMEIVARTFTITSRSASHDANPIAIPNATRHQFPVLNAIQLRRIYPNPS